MIRFNKTLSFFDSDIVKRSIDKTTRKAFGRFGAFVRSISRRSIRRRKRTSKPGESPTSRKGLLKKFLFFSLDTRSRSVVIGPTRLSGATGDIPRVLEEGGTIVARRARFRRKRKGQGKLIPARRAVTIAARPFMGPAFAKGQDKLDTFWAQSVKR